MYNGIYVFMYTWLCCRSTPRPDLMPTSSRRKCGLSNAAMTGWIDNTLSPGRRRTNWLIKTARSTLYLYTLPWENWPATVGVVLTKPKLDHLARCSVTAQSFFCVTPWEPKKKEKHLLVLTFITALCFCLIRTISLTPGLRFEQEILSIRLEKLTLHQCLYIDHSLMEMLCWKNVNLWWQIPANRSRQSLIMYIIYRSQCASNQALSVTDGLTCWLMESWLDQQVGLMSTLTHLLCQAVMLFSSGQGKCSYVNFQVCE